MFIQTNSWPEIHQFSGSASPSPWPKINPLQSPRKIIIDDKFIGWSKKDTISQERHHNLDSLSHLFKVKKDRITEDRERKLQRDSKLKNISNI